MNTKRNIVGRITEIKAMTQPHGMRYTITDMKTQKTLTVSVWQAAKNMVPFNLIMGQTYVFPVESEPYVSKRNGKEYIGHTAFFSTIEPIDLSKEDLPIDTILVDGMTVETPFEAPGGVVAASTQKVAPVVDWDAKERRQLRGWARKDAIEHVWRGQAAGYYPDLTMDLLFMEVQKYTDFFLDDAYGVDVTFDRINQPDKPEAAKPEETEPETWEDPRIKMDDVFQGTQEAS